MHPSPPLASPDNSQPPKDLPFTPAQPAAQHADDDLHHSLPAFDGRGADGRKGKGRERRPNRLEPTTPRKPWDLDRSAGGDDASQSDDDDDGDNADSPTGAGSLARGQVESALLLLPIESLHEILSYLPPSALLVLRQVARHLLAAVDDEAVWRACYLRNYIRGGTGVGAISRSCLPGAGGKSWKKEALGRERLLDRMSRSKTPVVTYDPRLSNLTTMSLFHPLPQPNTLPHQLRPPSLLSASLAHGLAARSDVTNGKVSKGYLDPWGTTDHTSLWQPPAHASPPTVLALASKRETPTIVWGFAEGGVGCTLVAGYATGNGKTSAKTFHAVAGEGHEGPVVALSGAKDGSIVLSGGADGRVILWAVPPPSAGRVQSTLQRLWVGRATADERAARETVRRVCWDERAGGTVASVTDSGVVTVWTGVVGAAGSDPAEGSSRQALWVDDELRASAVGDRDRTVTLVLDVEDLLPSSATGTENSTAAVTIRVLLHATPSDSFKQLAITFPADRSETPLVVPTVFAPPSAGGTELTCFHTELAVPLPPGLPFQHSTSLAPTPALSRIPSSDAVALAPGPPATVATDAEERQILRLPMSTSIERRTLGSVGQGKFLVTGDGEGVVRLWNWDDGRLVRQWRAIDGKVTALECTMGLVLVGSLEGVLKVYDPLASPPTLLRTFNDRSATRHLRPHLAAGALDPALWRVSQIVLERDMLVACVGGKILSWRMGSGGREREGRSEWKGKVVNKKAGTSGWAGMRTPNGKSGHSQFELQSEISSARLAHREAQESLQTAVTKDQVMRDKVFGGLDLTAEEQMAYALLLSQEEEEARRRSVPVEATVAAPEATQPSSSGPVDDNEMDDPLRQALERSLLDQSVEADDDDDDQFELLFDDDALVAGAGASSSSAAAGRPLYSASPVRPSWCAQEARPSSSSLPSAAPTPVFGSFDDRTEWPAMLSSSPPPVGKGKQQQQPQQAASSPVPSAPRPSGQLAWSSVARSPPSTNSACMSPSLVAQASPSLRATGGVRPMTREEREDEELRLVLEMSLNDQ